MLMFRKVFGFLAVATIIALSPSAACVHRSHRNHS
jgi:hypothetical protein